MQPFGTYDSDDLRHAWDTIYGTYGWHIPFYSHIWHAIWHRQFGHDGQPLPIIVGSDIIAPFSRTNDAVTFSGGEEIADYLDLIGNDDSKQQAWNEILKFLKSERVKSVRLVNVPSSSPTVRFFREHSSQMRVSVVPEDVTPVISLPSDWDAYLMTLSRKDRHELRRKLRKFRVAYPDVSYRTYGSDAAPIEETLKLMKLNPKKKDFLTDQMAEFFRLLPKIIPGLTIHALTGKTGIVAAKICFETPTSYLVYNSGYDPEVSDAGYVLTAEMIRSAIGHSTREFNFLQGAERYKYDFGAENLDIVTIHAEL
jgi:CelD/BcsL family acetyltransferase involved in cellulose biosynthesis